MTTKNATDAEIEFLRELLEEAEFDRLGAMTPEQLQEELKDVPAMPEGWGQELLRRVIARVDAREAAEKGRRGR